MEHYQIVTARGVDSDSVLRKLAQEVGQNILKGWNLAGSLSMCHSGANGGTMLVAAQAMTKPRIEHRTLQRTTITCPPRKKRRR